MRSQNIKLNDDKIKNLCRLVELIKTEKAKKKNLNE